MPSLFYIIKFEIINGNRHTVGTTLFLQKIKDAAVFQDALEEVERFVVLKVDLTAKIEEPFAFNVECIPTARPPPKAIMRFCKGKATETAVS